MRNKSLENIKFHVVYLNFYLQFCINLYTLRAEFPRTRKRAD